MQKVRNAADETTLKKISIEGLSNILMASIQNIGVVDMTPKNIPNVEQEEITKMSLYSKEIINEAQRYYSEQVFKFLSKRKKKKK